MELARARLKDPGLRTLRGHLLPVKGEPEGSDDDEGETSDPEFLDAEEIEGGGLQIQSQSPQNSRVKIKAEDSREYLVSGFFPLVDPWWRVTVDVKQSRSQYFVKGFPSYELDDEQLGKDSILALFLKHCGVSDEWREEFLGWLPHFPPVTFTQLPELAESFKADGGKDLMPYLRGAGKFVLKALELPLVMKYLPKLLPHKFKGLLAKLDLLEDLETILSTAPWKLGFALILFREFNLCGCEAKWDSFLQCDDLLYQIPELQFHALILYDELKRKCMDLGDTYVERPDLTKAISKDMSIENAWEALKFLEDEKVVVREGQMIFLHNNHQYEVDISEYVEKLVNKGPWNQVDEKDIFDSTTNKEPEIVTDAIEGIPEPWYSDGESCLEQIEALQVKDPAVNSHCSPKLDEEQKKAAKMILANPVTVISGKGGCGKTTVVSLVFRSVMQKENDEVEAACKALEEDDDMSDEWACHAKGSEVDRSNPARVLLTAPTGKAASLLKKKTELPAATLHQITCSYSAWKKKEESGEQNGPWKFSKVEALVVDEGSLVSIRIFSAVLKLLFKHAKLAKLVILGDVRQLPSIEPGNLLADVFAAFGRMKWAIELQTNHRAESQLIVDNATRISQQRNMQFDAVVHFDQMSSTAMPAEDKKCILVSLASECDLSTAIKALLKKGPGLEDDHHSQFIAFRRKDCLLINELCCWHYAGHAIKTGKKYEFRFQDKVCCTKNAYVKDLLSKNREDLDSSGTLSNSQYPTAKTQPIPGSMSSGQDVDADERICNGEVFYITDDVQRGRIRELTLSDGEDRAYTLNYKALRTRGGLRHAWARTIHTFQGSEEDTVVYVLGNAGRQNWKHVYTAVTRGRKRVYIIAMSHQLDQSIASKARERKTRLQQRLKEKLQNQNRAPEAATSSTTIVNPAKVDNEPQMKQDINFTQLRSPPRSKCPPIPTTPDFALSKKGSDNEDKSEDISAHHMMLTPPGSSAHHDSPVQGPSSAQKRTGNPWDNITTPSKMQCFTIQKETSPTNQTGIENLSIHSPCHKQLFKP